MELYSKWNRGQTPADFGWLIFDPYRYQKKMDERRSQLLAFTPKAPIERKPMPSSVQLSFAWSFWWSFAAWVLLVVFGIPCF